MALDIPSVEGFRFLAATQKRKNLSQHTVKVYLIVLM